MAPIMALVQALVEDLSVLVVDAVTALASALTLLI